MKMTILLEEYVTYSKLAMSESRTESTAKVEKKINVTLHKLYENFKATAVGAETQDAVTLPHYDGARVSGSIELVFP